MPTMLDILNAKRFSEAYLNRKFKNNDEFFREVFDEWWYKSRKPLGEFLESYLLK